MNHVLQAGNILKASTQQGDQGDPPVHDNFNVIAECLDWAYYTTMVRPESANYTANTGMATISTANSLLTGGGDLGTVLTAASNGTIIQSVVIKAQVTTSLGMVRLFLYDGTNTRLFREIPVPAITKSGVVHSFSHRIDFAGKDFALKSGWSLKASTEKGEAFNVIAEGLDWTYPDVALP